MSKQLFWSNWSITTKILITLLVLSALSVAVTWYLAAVSLREIGDYALESAASLGESAIRDSTSHLVKLGEDTVSQISRDVAKQVGMYLESHPNMDISEMRNDPALREIVVQPVGITGYSTLIDPGKGVIVIHQFTAQEKDVGMLQSSLPSFWRLIEITTGGQAAAGYYDWQEVDGTVTRKYASVTPIVASNYSSLTIWATTYISEFSQPIEQTKAEISSAIMASHDYINRSVADMRNGFAVISSILVIVVTGLALLLSRVITRPIISLKQGAEAIGQGNLDYEIRVKKGDELGKLADSFNSMAFALKNNMADNIAKERIIQENLRAYARQVSQAQEAERKRIARELHDETAQKLVVIARRLDDIDAGDPTASPRDVRREVQIVLDGVRRFSQELRPSVLDDLGLIPAVKWLVSDLGRNHKIHAEVEISGKPRQLAAETELALFRIVQEALTNVRKHANASGVSVRFEFLPDVLNIYISDNGKGFVVPERVSDLTRENKLGLTGIEERVQLVGGTLSIESQSEEGTSLIVRIPTKL